MISGASSNVATDDDTDAEHFGFTEPTDGTATGSNLS